jgi:predicted HNH restriction endonuclease
MNNENQNGKKRKKRVYNEKFRLKEILKLLLLKHNEKCYFCGNDFNNGDFEKITIHHIDFNHYNNNLNNLTLSHRNCHKKFHLLKNRNLVVDL